MAFADLREFIAALERAGELKRIPTPVDPRLEITEVADRVSKRGGPALLFENPTGYAGKPLLINQFGSRRRMAMALGVDHADEVAARIRALLEMKPPEGLLGKLKMLPTLAEMGSFFPRTVKSGACQEVVHRDHLNVLDFPILQCWPEDGGRYITFPLVFSRHPSTGRRNVGMYRLQVYDGQTLGMHWQIHKQGADHLRERQQAADRAQAGETLRRAHGLPDVQAPLGPGHAPGGRRMEVAVAIGTDPATTFAAILP
ncbi:MAG TPA: UbiD family decarboxylase domain-containing protein, partial [Terriglobales bacterium]